MPLVPPQTLRLLPQRGLLAGCGSAPGWDSVTSLGWAELFCAAGAPCGGGAAGAVALGSEGCRRASCRCAACCSPCLGSGKESGCGLQPCFCWERAFKIPPRVLPLRPRGQFFGGTAGLGVGSHFLCQSRPRLDLLFAADDSTVLSDTMVESLDNPWNRNPPMSLTLNSSEGESGNPGALWAGADR